MRRFEGPYVADWFATSLRWLVLVCLGIWLSLRGLENATLLVLILMLIWNVAMSIMAGMSLRLARFHRQIVLAVDFLLALLLFFSQGGLVNSTFWEALIPIGVGAIYFEMWGAFLTAVVFASLQAVISRDEFATFNLIASGGLVTTLLIGLAGGLIGRYTMRRLRVSRQSKLDAEERRRLMETERLRAIYELTSSLTATLSYRRVLDSVLDLGYNALNPILDPDEQNDERLVSAIFLFKGNELTIGSARRFTNADVRANLQGKDGILKRVLDEGEAVLTRDIGFPCAVALTCMVPCCSPTQT
jgi:hypothetical protein